MKTIWLMTFQQHPDYSDINLRSACLAMAAIASNGGKIIIKGGDEQYKKIAKCSRMKHGDLMTGLSMAQKKQWLAPFTMNEELQATTHLTTPEGAVSNVANQD
jgi:hypothetical protein